MLRPLRDAVRCRSRPGAPALPPRPRAWSAAGRARSISPSPTERDRPRREPKGDGWTAQIEYGTTGLYLNSSPASWTKTGWRAHAALRTRWRRRAPHAAERHAAAGTFIAGQRKQDRPIRVETRRAGSEPPPSHGARRVSRAARRHRHTRAASRGPRRRRSPPARRWRRPRSPTGHRTPKLLVDAGGELDFTSVRSPAPDRLRQA